MLLKPNFGALGVILAKKALQKMLRKRGTRPDGNRTLLPWQKAPGGRPTIKNCSNKKQLFGHMLKQLFVMFLEKVDRAENRCRKCGLGSKSVQSSDWFIAIVC